MSASYYDALLPVREPGNGLRAVLAGLRPPHRVLASIRVPAGRIVVAFVSDSARLSRMFTANWAPAGTDQMFAPAGPRLRRARNRTPPFTR